MPTPLFAEPIQLPDRGFAPLTTTFYARISGGRPPYKALWDFRDGTTKEMGEPEFDTYHTFLNPGFYNVRLTVTDDANNQFVTYVAVDVQGEVIQSFPPSITSSLNVSANTGDPFSYNIIATNSPTSYSALNLPASLTINVNSGQITGTVDADGVYNVTISATNDDGTDTETLVITSSTFVGVAPVLNPPGDQCFVLGQYDSFNVTSDPNPASVSWNVTGLPSGLWSYSPSPGTLQIYGDADEAGSFTVNVEATNAYGSDNIDIVLNVTTLALFVQSSSGPYDGEYRACELAYMDYDCNTATWGLVPGSSPNGDARVWRNVNDPNRALFYNAAYGIWVLDIPTSYTGSTAVEGFNPFYNGNNAGSPAQGNYCGQFATPYISQTPNSCSPPQPYLPGGFVNLPEFIDFTYFDIALYSTDAWSFSMDSVPPGCTFDPVSGLLTGNSTGSHFTNVTAYNATGQYSAGYTFNFGGGK